MIETALKKLSSGEDLESGLMQLVMEKIMAGEVETPLIVDFLVGLNKKGYTVDEITEAVRVMRNHATKIHSSQGVILDTCGTGGDKKGTFNISTVTAFVVSGCGVAVAKHGNRSVSSCCGSADILEALGIAIQASPSVLARCLDEIGIAFLFAQHLHPAMKHAMPARKQIGERTIFNLLGPLTNPANATHQLIGVFDGCWTEVIAKVLKNLGTVHALVVHGEDGLDEVTTTETTRISEVNRGDVKTFQVRPEEYGLKRARLDDLKGGNAADNAEILVSILKGSSGPRRDIVVLNAAAALYAADKVSSIEEGMNEAISSIDSGKAFAKLESLRERMHA
jgi:anthranilate phosphoribosyltransferase